MSRHTTCSVHAIIVLGSIGAIVVQLAIFSGPLNPISGAVTSPTPLEYIPVASREDVVTAKSSPEAYPDLDVDFRDGEALFGSDIPAGNGADWYLRERRAAYEYPSSCTKGGSKVVVKPSAAQVLSTSSGRNQDNPPQNVKVLFSVAK